MTQISEIEQVVIDPDAKPTYREPGDDEKFSHYVDKVAYSRAVLEGTPVTALCGKTWVPTRDPEKFPVCPQCKDIWESLEPGDDD